MVGILKNRWRLLVGLALGGLMVAFLGVSFFIGHQVQDVVDQALAATPGDPVTALLVVAQSSTAPLDDRNSAVWALGQLGDQRALPELEALKANANCDHQSQLCEYGLTKAIELCRGATNLGALLWRPFVSSNG